MDLTDNVVLKGCLCKGVVIFPRIFSICTWEGVFWEELKAQYVKTFSLHLLFDRITHSSHWMLKINAWSMPGTAV